MLASRHFQRREPAGTPDFEDAYWHIVVDPDGRRRDRLAEREQHLLDVREELNFVNGLAATRVLDVGCGAGFFLSGIAPHHQRHGVEVSRFGAEHARQWATVHTGTLQSAAFARGWFGAIVLHHVIEHVDDPGAMLGEIMRVLAPEGWLVLGTPDFDSACARRFGERYRLLHDPTHVSLFSAESMHRFLRERGFVIERVHYPFFETRHFTRENLLRLFDVELTSPPFYGNFMTFYARRPRHPHWTAASAAFGVVLPDDVRRAEAEGARLISCLAGARASARRVWLAGGPVGLESCLSRTLEAAGLAARPLAPGQLPGAGDVAVLLDPMEPGRAVALESAGAALYVFTGESNRSGWPTGAELIELPETRGVGTGPATYALLSACVAELDHE